MSAPDAEDEKTFLVPVDLSACTDRVIEFARSYASAMDRKVTLLYVWSLPPFSPAESLYVTVGQDHRPLIDHVRAESEQRLGRVMAGPEDAARVADRRVVIGDPTSQILDMLGGGHHDLVILGTHGHTGLSHLALGSVAEKVLRRSPVPTLIVPCRPKAKEKAR